MPSLDKYFLEQLHDDFKKYTCFIETGTHNGDTTFAVEPYFDEIYTIELAETYYYNAKSKYYGDKIKFILGDSSIVLEKLLPTITAKSIFFLDGHWSGGDTARSNKDCPLEEEITHINELYKQEGIIIIDDFRLFGLDKSSGKLNEDWSNINKEKLLKILEKRINKVYHLDSACCKDDRLIIHINAK